MPNFLLSGASGRMGQEIIGLSRESKTLAYKFGWSRRPVEQGHVSLLSAVNPNEIDLVIDFSLPIVFDEILQWAQLNKKPFFSGTTGLSSKQVACLADVSKDIPVLLASNTSLGVNFVKSLLKYYGAIKEFDFQIIETHHNKKLDAPSGTAITLQQELNKAIGKTAPEPLAIRGGGVCGDHSIIALSDEEQITLEHRALSRSVFAKGALRGAAWLKDQPPGQYSMAHVLGLE